MATATAYARIAALRSPETEAALNALVGYQSRSPDPRDPDHAPTLRRLQHAYIEASQADGSHYAARVDELERWADQADARALDYPAHAERYAREAANLREAAAEARAKLALIVPAERLAA